jgi:hypothetical protein
MSGATPEPRAAVMILVEASWKDQTGAVRMVPACVEDKSAGGACIRTKTPISVGSKLTIEGRWDQITGIARYCRKVGREYLVGVQRDTANGADHGQPFPADVPKPESEPRTHPLAAARKLQSRTERRESTPTDVAARDPELETVSMGDIASFAAAMTPQEDREIVCDRLGIMPPRASYVLRHTELRAELPAKRIEAGNERKHMQRKWFDLAPWRNQKNGDGLNGNGNSNGKSEQANRRGVPSTRTVEDPAGENVASFQVELLSMEDIYRTAGIVNPRRGYGISKVVEMAHSEHSRGLSREAKRAAVLMALDAAGITIDAVLKDARTRQAALDAYEAEQKKAVEAEWALKAEENVKMQAELERVKAHYLARIGRNLDGIAREKAAFSNWLTTKQQESQSISDATDLCVKSTVSEPSSLSAGSMAQAGRKPM